MSAAQPRYVSPLRYPGGKAKLTAFIKLLMAKNELVGGEYVEVFAGGASVGLSLLLGGYVSKIHLNDIDSGIYAFWHSVLNNCDELCGMIRTKRVSVAEWERQRSVYHDTRDRSLLERGFATFFLNRTNRSGIIASGGMIGGRAQTGSWKLNARYNKKNLIDRITRIAERADDIRLYRDDGARLITRRLRRRSNCALVYLDPPYYVKGGRRLYANSYGPEDHEALSKLVSDLDLPWIVSYDNVVEIVRLYRNFRKRKFTLSYTASERTSGEEVIFFSPSLKIPRVAQLVGADVARRAAASEINQFS